MKQLIVSLTLLGALGTACTDDNKPHQIHNVELSALAELVADAKVLRDNAVVGEGQGQHSLISYNSLEQVINEADELIVSENDQSSIDAMYTKLKTAMETFQAEKNTVDKTNLQSLVAQAEEISDLNLNLSDNLKVWLDAEIKAGKTILADASSSNAAVLLASKNLLAVIQAVKAVDTQAVSISGLKAEITLAKELTAAADSQRYPAQALEAFLAEINKAEELLSSNNLTEEVIAAALSQIKEAKKTFEQSEIQLDQTQLQRGLASARLLLDNSEAGEGDGKYPQDQRDQFQSVIEQAADVLSSSPATQADIDTMVSLLEEAVATFTASKITVDRSPLELVITESGSLLGTNENASVEQQEQFQLAIDEAKSTFNKQAVTEAEVLSAIDALNSAKNSYLAISPKGLSYDEIKEKSSHHLEVTPWTDTYWPFFMTGHAHRWEKTEHEPDSFSESSYVSFVKFFKEYIDIIESGDQSRMIILSPAEKYDFLRLGDNAESLEAAKAANPANKRLIENLETAEELSLSSEAGLALSETEDIKEIFAWAEDIEEKVRSGAIDTITGASLLREEIDQSAFLRRNFPTVAEAWQTFSSFQGDRQTESWGWQGHCGGWSPAALHEEAPKHGVLVSKQGREVLFTQGDIRGLLSKSWTAPQAPKLSQKGENCSKDPEYIAGGNGYLSYRQYDGNFLVENESGDFVPQDPFKILSYFPVASAEGRLLGVSFVEKSALERPIFGLYYREGFGPGDFRAKIFSYGDKDKLHLFENRSLGTKFLEFGDKSELVAWAADKNQGSDVSALNSRIINVDHSCLDLTPDLMTKLLVEEFKDKGTKMVVDRDFTSEKWNQPVEGYDFTIGALKPISDLNAGERRFLSANTKYFAEVTGSMSYITEPRHHLPVTPKGFDKANIVKLELAFVLEFDENKSLSGGYWQPVSNTTPNAGTLRRFKPDYLGYFEDTKPLDVVVFKSDYNSRPGAATNKNSSVNDIRDLNKIHACSIDSTAETETVQASFRTSEGQSETVTYTRCTID
ncbi:MAG: FIVAR domain-containing protein [Pseudobacteriovorax sp.]|nr:FIVAR domain-containing protein [Pseudobacteriovorax sp.]